MRQNDSSVLKAVLGPTNTGKTHYAIERLCAHSSGVMGFPLRLLAREVYDRVVAIKGPREVGLITGEERILPAGAKWLLCTTESMPTDRDVAFVAIDEAQLGVDAERGHVFTDRLLRARGREETLILGSHSLKPVIDMLLPRAEIVTRPRFSQLTHAPAKKFSRLPPRTAIIAFSADEVYAIAELIRQHCGGAAIVMGNLSPRTRNAQVEMYQAGEVDYIVATDAIGMGLNMDIGHVAFASLRKFDGSRHRRLAIHEMAQIAGRAGRHQRDGTFGVAISGGDTDGFSEHEIDHIETHRVTPNHWLFWRNSDLDFASADRLISSLACPPPHPGLRPAPEADDFAVLRSLSIDPAISQMTRGESATRRLWDACGLPDFKSVGADFHAKQVARLFQYLGSGNGHIPASLIGAETSRLDDLQGNIAALSSRLASIRTWSYISQRADWLEAPQAWIERTREIEQRLSDALHRQLTERFVDKRASHFLRSKGRAKLPGDFAVEETGRVLIFDEPVGTLRAFRFTADTNAPQIERKRMLAEVETRLPAEMLRRAKLLADAQDQHITLHLKEGDAPSLYWQGGLIASLKRGRDLLKPEFSLDASVARLESRARDMVHERLVQFVRSYPTQRLTALSRTTELAFSSSTSPAVRSILAPIAFNGGILLRSEVNALITTLTQDQRRELRKSGIVIGRLTLFHPTLLKPAATELRLALAAVRADENMPPVPMAGLGLLDCPSPTLTKAAEQAGYFRFGNQMLRFDLLERLAEHVHAHRQGQRPFAPDATFAASIGVGTETLARVLRALGFTPFGPAKQNQWRWRGAQRRRFVDSKPSNRAGEATAKTFP